MKLENLLSSPDGLPRNQIVDLRYPEERMAARLIERLGIAPPIDVERVCRGLADLCYKDFPIKIDGLCLDLKVSGRRPKVWLSKDIPPVRQRFTLAHEIGHIIIPWHTGTIIDDIDAPRSNERSKYREMEAEANRFAAELLMPTSWAIGLSERSDHVAGLMHTIHQVAEVSLPAAFLKAAKLGKSGFVGAEVREGIITRSVRTSETNSRPPERNMSVADVVMPAAYDPEIIRGKDVSYYWWKIREFLEDPGGDIREWRDILEEILIGIPAEFRAKTRASVNAIIGAAIGKEPKGASITVIYKRGMEAAQNRESESTWVRYTISHARFKEYILARSRDRSGKQ